MTKVALICDTHLGVRNDSVVFHEYFRKSFDHFFNYIDENDIKHVIHLGDLFDRRKYVNYLTAKICRELFLQPIAERKLNAHILCGNHDQYYKDTHDVNALDELVSGRYDTIQTYTRPGLIDIGGVPIQMLPWITNSNSEESYEAIKNSASDILMGHLELAGFEMFRGIVSETGDDKELFSRYDLVFSGHYHKKSSKDNIHYLGAFAEYTWADYNDPRGFTIFDTQTRKFEFIRNPYNIFKMIAYDDEKYKDDIIQRITKRDYSEFKDTYVKIICTNRNNPYAFDMLLDKLYKAMPNDVTIVEGLQNYSIDDEDTINEAEDTPTIMEKYIDGLSLPLDSDKLKRYMKTIYQEAVAATIND